jgi:hypothetical protein
VNIKSAALSGARTGGGLVGLMLEGMLHDLQRGCIGAATVRDSYFLGRPAA